MSKKKNDVEKKANKKVVTGQADVVVTEKDSPITTDVVEGTLVKESETETKDTSEVVQPLEVQAQAEPSAVKKAPPISVLINIRAYAANMAANRPTTVAQCAVQQELFLASLTKIIGLPASSGAMAGLYEILADTDNTAFSPRLITRALGDTNFDERKRAAFVLLTTTLMRIATAEEEVSVEWDALENALSAAGYDGETMVATIQDSAAR